MDKFVSRKIVEAAPIIDVNIETRMIDHDQRTEIKAYMVVKDDREEDGRRTYVIGLATPNKAPAVGDYVVRYSDGYTSWSPKKAFEEGYTSADAMPFGDALQALKEGRKVARRGWNGEGMFLFLVPGSTFKVNRAPLLGIYSEGTEINYRPHIDIRTASGEIGIWVPSQCDALADDWYIVE